jgi:hypothetical protein
MNRIILVAFLLSQAFRVQITVAQDRKLCIVNAVTNNSISWELNGSIRKYSNSDSFYCLLASSFCNLRVLNGPDFHQQIDSLVEMMNDTIGDFAAHIVLTSIFGTNGLYIFEKYYGINEPWQKWRMEDKSKSIGFWKRYLNELYGDW